MKSLFLLIAAFTWLSQSFEVEAKLLENIKPLVITNNSDLESIDKAVKFALLDKNWLPRGYSEGSPHVIFATLNVYAHSLTVKVEYDLNTVSISYHESENLKYREVENERHIHKAYFEWTAWLLEEIEKNINNPEYSFQMSDICFKELANRIDALPNSDFRLSRERLATRVCSSDFLSIIVSDQRPYVLSGEKKRSFSGLKRISWGIPLSFNAKESHTTSEVVAEGLRLVLESAIPKAKGFGITDNTSFDDYIEGENIEGKLLLVTLNEWKYDKPPKGFGKTAFYYDLDIDVKFQGETIATHNLKDKRIVKSIKLINEDYAWTYESIFDSPSIRSAFSSNLSPSPQKVLVQTIDSTQSKSVPLEIKSTEANKDESKGTSCSVDQIMTMNELGLDERQIKAACSN